MRCYNACIDGWGRITRARDNDAGGDNDTTADDNDTLDKIIVVASSIFHVGVELRCRNSLVLSQIEATHMNATES